MEDENDENEENESEEQEPVAEIHASEKQVHGESREHAKKQRLADQSNHTDNSKHRRLRTAAQRFTGMRVAMGQSKKPVHSSCRVKNLVIP